MYLKSSEELADVLLQIKDHDNPSSALSSLFQLIAVKMEGARPSTALFERCQHEDHELNEGQMI